MENRLSLGVTSALEIILLLTVGLVLYYCRKKLCCCRESGACCDCAKSTSNVGSLRRSGGALSRRKRRREGATATTTTPPEEPRQTSHSSHHAEPESEVEPEGRVRTETRRRPRSRSFDPLLGGSRPVSAVAAAAAAADRRRPRDPAGGARRLWRQVGRGGGGAQRWELPVGVYEHQRRARNVRSAGSAGSVGSAGSTGSHLGLAYAYWMNSEVMLARRAGQDATAAGSDGGGSGRGSGSRALGWSVWQSTPHLLAYTADYNQGAPLSLNPPPYHLVADADLTSSRVGRAHSDPNFLSRDYRGTRFAIQQESPPPPYEPAVVSYP